MTPLIENASDTQVPVLDALVSPEQTAVPLLPSTPVAAKERIYRHKLPVRLGHWLNAVCLFILVMSGLQIFNAHPALYWGDRSDRDRPLLSIRTVKTEDGNIHGITTILGQPFDTTGVLGYSNGSGRA